MASDISTGREREWEELCAAAARLGAAFAHFVNAKNAYVKAAPAPADTEGGAGKVACPDCGDDTGEWECSTCADTEGGAA